MLVSIHCPGAVPRGFSSALGAFHQIRLPLVDLRHFALEAAESLLDLIADFLAEDQLSTQRIRHRVARQVVFGGTEARR